MNTKTLDPITTTVDAEVIDTLTTKGEKMEVAQVKKNLPFIAENGEVNLAALSDEQITKCRAITKNLSPKAVGSVSNYGIELQSKLADSGKSFLSAARTSRSGEVGKIMGDLVASLDQINIKDLEEPNAVIKVLQKIPVVNTFVPSIKKVLRKYDTIDESLQQIEDSIKGTQLKAIADNNALQQMFDTNKAYLLQLEDLIVAGTLATDDARNQLATMMNEGADGIAISDQEAFIQSLEKKIHDLKSVRLIAKQNLMQIRIIQRNNIVSSDNAQSMMTLTMPVFRTQLALAIALNNQSDGIKVQKTVREKTDALLRTNADILHTNTLEVTKAANESIVSSEAIKASAEKMRETVEAIKKIQQDAEAKRNEESRELASIEHNIDAIIGTSVISSIDTATKGVSLLN